MLKKEEDLKVQLAALEESLLQELAMAEGNILENKTLLDSLNETKAKGITIANALKESVTLQASIDKVLLCASARTCVCACVCVCTYVHVKVHTFILETLYVHNFHHEPSKLKYCRRKNSQLMAYCGLMF